MGYGMRNTDADKRMSGGGVCVCGGESETMMEEAVRSVFPR